MVTERIPAADDVLPDYAAHPGELLAEELEERGMSQRTLAQNIGPGDQRLPRGEADHRGDSTGPPGCAGRPSACLAWLADAVRPGSGE